MHPIIFFLGGFIFGVVWTLMIAYDVERKMRNRVLVFEKAGE